jgi:hypothetical protein
MDKATGANRKVPNPVLIAGGVLVVVVFFWVWYVVAADYGYGALSGTYILQSGPETSTLILRENRIFEQQQSHMGREERVRGTWRRVGEAGIAFSHEFLNTQQQNPGLDREVYGGVEKRRLGLIPYIVLDPVDSSSPTFRKQFFFAD